MNGAATARVEENAPMNTKMETVGAQLDLSPRQKEFCAILSGLMAKPEFDLLDQSGVWLTMKGGRLQVTLPHRIDPSLTIVAVLSRGSLESLRVWDFEFVNHFQTMFGGQQDSPDVWALRITDLLLGRVSLEKWTKDGSVLQSRINRYSSELGKWIVGDTVTQRKGFLGIQITQSTPVGKDSPPGSLREEKHVFFSSAHGIPKFSATV
jgi:hypothetical protein